MKSSDNRSTVVRRYQSSFQNNVRSSTESGVILNGPAAAPASAPAAKVTMKYFKLITTKQIATKQIPVQISNSCMILRIVWDLFLNAWRRSRHPCKVWFSQSNPALVPKLFTEATVHLSFCWQCCKTSVSMLIHSHTYFKADCKIFSIFTLHVFHTV